MIIRILFVWLFIQTSTKFDRLNKFQIENYLTRLLKCIQFLQQNGLSLPREIN